ncbi:unnamed protein product [Mytilus coruscus]|uniref:Uncharacterized protein n=1 Tax=Mytilus coruscus TaxID=42192 RepID=A0A6J8C0K6_MYTCO|nr:unnamed protein product [Mytilus coruscus]
MSRLPELLQKGTSCSKISSESIEAICNATPPIPAIETSNTDQKQITLDYKEQDDNDSLIFDQVEYNVNDTADVSISDPLPTQDTGSVVAGDALHPGDQSEDDEQEHSVSLESEVESGQESTIIVDDDIEHSNSDINQGSETNDIVVNNQEDIAPTPAPSRSKRTTTQPNWMKSGEFIMGQQSNWLAKAEFLKGLAMSGMFPSAEKDIGRALVKIVTENT